MKPTMALKPLVFALAAVMAMAAQAGNDDNHGHGRGHGHDHDHGPSLSTLLQITAGASATVLDSQSSHNNTVVNQGTLNNGSVNSSLNNASGNMGANVAAGNDNQQDNAAALATADESFIFGSAYSATSATQTNKDNSVINSSNTNNGSLNSSANYGSGNMGVNVTAGSYNQQKNNLAIAVSGGRVATATAAANQTSSGQTVVNAATQAYKKDTLTGTFTASGAFVAAGVASSGNDHGNGGGNGGWGNDDRGGHGNGNGHGNSNTGFVAVGLFELGGVYTQQVLTPDGWKNPVTNNASMNNSANFMSGNGGYNVSAGSGNQQSNSLSIAAGCKACM